MAASLAYKRLPLSSGTGLNFLKPRQCVRTRTSITFYEHNKKGTEDDLPKESIAEKINYYVRNFVPDTNKFIQEQKLAYTTGVMLEADHGNYEVIFRFDNKPLVDRWVVTTDKDNVQGKSTANFVLSQNRTGLFRGNLCKDVPKDGKTKYAGYANITSPKLITLFTIENTHGLCGEVFKWLGFKFELRPSVHDANFNGYPWVHHWNYGVRFLCDALGRWDTVLQRDTEPYGETHSDEKSFRRETHWNWSLYNCLVMKVRGDGRAYMVVLGCDFTYDVNWLNRWCCPLFTRGGPYWQVAKIPFSKFFLSHHGRIQDRQEYIPLSIVNRLGVTVADAAQGPYCLEIDSISVMYDANVSSKHAYELYDNRNLLGQT